MKITCAFQYELYVDETRRAALSRNAGCCRFVFNKALGIQNERKSKGEKLLTYKELAHELVLWKKQPETAFLREAMSQPLQQALLDLDRAISDSFRPKSDPAHKGWPKFKAKDIGDGFRIPQFAPEHIDDANGRVKLPKIGWIRYRRTRPIAFECADGMLVPGVVKQIHVRKDCGHWFVIFTVEFEVKVPDMKALDVGIDVGVVHAVATSDGRFYDLDTAKIRSTRSRERNSRSWDWRSLLTRSSRVASGVSSRRSFKSYIERFVAFDRISTGRRRMRSRRSTAACTSRT